MYCSAAINWRTPLVCSGGGAGWTITILIFVAAAVYVAGGIGYSRFVKNSHHGKGFVEAHPHYEGWLELPALTRDGYVRPLFTPPL